MSLHNAPKNSPHHVLLCVHGEKDVHHHDPLWLNTPTALPAPELWYSFKAAIIRRLTSSRCYNKILWEWIQVPRELGCLPPLKVTEILPILHDDGGGGAAGWWGGWSWLGGAYESESHCCLGFHPALTAPVQQISFTQQIPPWWETEGRQLKADWLTEHVAKAPTVLILIIDQMIKADEETFFFFFLKWAL